MGYKEDIGLKIRIMRKSRGMTQEDLAKAIDQSPSSITMYETGRREPNFETLEAIADAFNVSLYEFIPVAETDRDFADMTTIEDEYRDRLEALHQNPELGMLFDRSRKMRPEDVKFMIQVADRILKGGNYDE